MKWPVFMSAVVLACCFGNAATAADQPVIEEKTLQSGTIAFQPALGQRAIPPNTPDRLTCQADVRYPEIRDTAKKARFHYRSYVNQRFRMLAEASLCTQDLASAFLQPTVKFFRGPIVSVMFHQTLYPADGNGSCHGTWKYMTFDLDTGKEYALADLLNAKDFPDIKAGIIDYFKKQEMDSKSIETHLDENFWTLGFYVDEEKIFIDMNAFLQSCVEGNHYSVEIDPKFFRESFENRPLFNAMKNGP